MVWSQWQYHQLCNTSAGISTAYCSLFLNGTCLSLQMNNAEWRRADQQCWPSNSSVHLCPSERLFHSNVSFLQRQRLWHEITLLIVGRRRAEQAALTVQCPVSNSSVVFCPSSGQPKLKENIKKDQDNLGASL